VQAKFYSNGKLLLTGEYLVLDGAKALAIPTIYGQSLKVKSLQNRYLFWRSKDKNNKIWFEAVFVLKHGNLFLLTEGNPIARTLHNILWEAKKLNPEFLAKHKSYQITTKLNFDQSWGLGSSSTLINNIAQWAAVDAFALLKNSFGGSGYDIACAQNDVPVVFTNNNGNFTVEKTHLPWTFTDHLFFVYRNKKQDSKKAIAAYRAITEISEGKHQKEAAIQAVNKLTEAFVACQTLESFENLIVAHEQLLSDLLKIPPVKEELFPDYKGAVKSLGGWGGDFMLVTGNMQDMAYFSGKGYKTILPFDEVIK